MLSFCRHLRFAVEGVQKHPGGLETGPIFQTKLQVRSTFQALTCGGHEIFAQHVCVSPLPLAAVGHERAIYFPRPLRTQGIWHPIFDVLPNGICVASNMCASSRNVIHPQETNLRSSSMCAHLRSIKHVCKFKEC